MYGRAVRLHNFARGAYGKAGGWRCTVCGNLKQANAADLAADKEAKHDGTK